MSQKKRFAEALKRSYVCNGNDGSSWCLHCLAYFTHTPYNVTHEPDCIVLEAAAYLAEEECGCNPEQTNELLDEAIQHFRKASVAVKDFASTKAMTLDNMKHYVKRADSHTAIADNLEALKNWSEKSK